MSNEGQTSPDGHWKWNGSEWVANDAGAGSTQPPAAPTPPKEKKPLGVGKAWAALSTPAKIGAAVLALLLLGIGAAAGGGSKSDSSATPGPTVTATTTAPAATTTATVAATTVTATQQVTTTYTPPAPTGYGDGTYVIGSDIQPGTYKSTGPDGSNTAGCYWAIQDSAGDPTGGDLGRGPAVMTVPRASSSAQTVKIEGCNDFIKQ